MAVSISDFILTLFGMISSILSWTEATKDTVSNGLAQFLTFSLLHTRMSSLNLVGSLVVVKMITIVKPLKAIDILSKKRIWTSLFIFIISYGVIFVCVVKQYVNMSSPNPIMAAFKSARGIIALCFIYLLLICMLLVYS